jgi:hypothetical protein
VLIHIVIENFTSILSLPANLLNRERLKRNIFGFALQGIHS